MRVFADPESYPRRRVERVRNVLRQPEHRRNLGPRLKTLKLRRQLVVLHPADQRLVEPERVLPAECPERENRDVTLNRNLLNLCQAVPSWPSATELDDEVARVAVTLASGLLPYTVGQPIFVDGGLLSVRY